MSSFTLWNGQTVIKVTQIQYKLVRTVHVYIKEPRHNRSKVYILKGEPTQYIGMTEEQASYLSLDDLP